MSQESSSTEQKDILTTEKLQHYLALTARALEKAAIAVPERSYLHQLALDFRKMAESYHSDAKHFFETGDYVNAFGAVNYAHGWLDAGARLGLFDVGGDDRLFTLWK